MQLLKRWHPAASLKTKSAALKIASIHCIGSRNFSKDLLWRAVNRDASIEMEPISIRDVFEKTRLLNHRDAESSELESSMISMAEHHRTRWPMDVAKLIWHLNNLPYGLSQTPSIESLINTYIECYDASREIQPIQSAKDCDDFYETVRYFMMRRLLAIPKICHGLLQKSTADHGTFTMHNTAEYLTEFIDRFASHRLATRVLSAHNLCLYEQYKSDKKSKKMGLFQENVNVMKCIQRAVMDASTECENHFVEFDPKYSEMSAVSFAPNVLCIDKRKNKTEFAFIPQHLHHVVFELLKNSMRAVLESNDDQKKSEITVVVVDNPSDDSIGIKLSDIGGGIPRADSNKIWRYGYTTGHGLDLVKHREVLAQIIDGADTQWENEIKDFDFNLWIDAVKYAPLFGLGYGLPITKLYARFTGGDCMVQSLHGYGTDAYLSLKNLRNNTRVVL